MWDELAAIIERVTQYWMHAAPYDELRLNFLPHQIDRIMAQRLKAAA